MIILEILAFIFGIGLIILVHEAGHFYFAKKSGILCYEFSIGMGPAIKQWKKGETTISLRSIPIGGYVSMATSDLISDQISEGDTVGLNFIDDEVSEIILDENLPSEVSGTLISKELSGEHGEDLEICLETSDGVKTYPVLNDAFYVFSNKEKLQITPYNRSFDSKKLYQRFLTLSAGVLMNFILAIIIYIIYYFAVGVPNLDSNVVGSVTSSYPAGSVLKEGDTITSLKSGDTTYEITSWTELSSAMDNFASLGCEEITVTYIRDEVTYEETISNIIVINNIGISNFVEDENSNAKILKTSSENKGVTLGKVSLKYDDDLATGEVSLKSYDIITEIRVDKYDQELKKYVESEYIEVTSWKDLTTSLDCDVAHVYFKFLSYNEDGSYKECETITPINLYSEEVLDAQNVEKFEVMLGISPAYHFSFTGCLKEAFVAFADSFMLVFNTLKALIAPSSSVHTIGLESFSGVVGIFDMIRTYLNAGFLPFLAFLAMLSVNIGVMNLLPIPALDGGRIVFLIYEAITKKKPNKKFEAILTNIVYIALIIFFIYVTYNDIQRLFS